MNRIASKDDNAILANDYILMSVGHQESIASYAPLGNEINAVILAHPERFRLIDTFPIPNGETIRLYQCVR